MNKKFMFFERYSYNKIKNEDLLNIFMFSASFYSTITNLRVSSFVGRKDATKLL